MYTEVPFVCNMKNSDERRMVILCNKESEKFYQITRIEMFLQNQLMKSFEHISEYFMPRLTMCVS